MSPFFSALPGKLKIIDLLGGIINRETRVKQKPQSLSPAALNNIQLPDLVVLGAAWAAIHHT